MNNTKIILIFIFSLFFQLTFGQLQQADEFTRGGTKSKGNIDLKVLTESKTHTFTITNGGKTILKVESIDIPAGISILISSKSAKPKEVIEIIVTADPLHLPKGKFNKKITVKTRQNDGEDITEKKMIFKVVGIVK